MLTDSTRLFNFAFELYRIVVDFVYVYTVRICAVYIRYLWIDLCPLRLTT